LEGGPEAPLQGPQLARPWRGGDPRLDVMGLALEVLIRAVELTHEHDPLPVSRAELGAGLGVDPSERMRSDLDARDGVASCGGDLLDTKALDANEDAAVHESETELISAVPRRVENLGFTQTIAQGGLCRWLRRRPRRQLRWRALGARRPTRDRDQQHDQC